MPARAWAQCLVFPESPFQITWMIQIIVMIFFYLFTVPVRLGFAETTDSDYVNGLGLWYGFDMYADIVFILDIGISFITVYRRKDGELETNHVKIAKKYMSRWFTLDLVASIPFTLLGLEVSRAEGVKPSLPMDNRVYMVLAAATIQVISAWDGSSAEAGVQDQT